MHYPMWGTSFLSGTFGLGFVAIAFFSVALATAGLGVINAYLLWRSQRTQNVLLQRFLENNSTRLTLIPTIASLLLLFATWLYAGMVMPQTVSTLVHLFMWFFAIEGVLIIVQTVSALIYVKMWNDLAPERRIKAGCVYAASSLGLVVTISMITSFMLTPGQWLENYFIWDAVINPTFIPSLIIHVGWALALGGAAMMLIANMAPDFTPLEKQDLEICAAKWMWALAVIVPIAILYLMAIPDIADKLSTPSSILIGVGIIATAAMALYMLTARLWKNERTGFAGSIITIALLVAATASFNISRSEIRAPYTISGYIYSNGIMVDEMPRLEREGLLSNATWIVPFGIDTTIIPAWKRGEWIYEAMGYKRYLGPDAKSLKTNLHRLDRKMRGQYINYYLSFDPKMPPFAGSERDWDDLNSYLLQVGEN